jgi:hypothetical protein
VKYSTEIVTAAVFFALGAGTVAYVKPDYQEPCIHNFSDSWLWYMEQSELRDIDETENEKKFHDMIVKILKEQNSLYVTRHGIEYVVPKNCYVEDNGFFVKLWKKND